MFEYLHLNGIVIVYSSLIGSTPILGAKWQQFSHQQCISDCSLANFHLHLFLNKLNQSMYLIHMWHSQCKDHFVYVPIQWERTLHCNVVSHWLGASTKCFLQWPNYEHKPSWLWPGYENVCVSSDTEDMKYYLCCYPTNCNKPLQLFCSWYGNTIVITTT